MRTFSSRWILPSLLALYSLNFMDRSVLAVVGEAMKADMGFSDAQLGLLHSVLLITLIFVVFPGAVLNDVWRRKKFIALCAVLWSMAMAGTALAGSFLCLCLARILASVNEGSTGSGGTAWLSQHYPAERRSKVLGIFQMGAPLGMALGTLLGGAVLSLTGNWRCSFFLFILPALVLAFVVLRLPDAQAPAGKNYFEGIPVLLRRRTLIMTACAGGFFCVLKYTWQSWLPVLLMRTYEVEPAMAALLSACFLLAGACGPFLGGMFADFWSRRSPNGRVRAGAAYMLLILCVNLVFYYAVGRLPLPALCALGMVDSIILMMPIPIYFSIVQDVVEDRYRGGITGLLGTMMFLFGGAWGPLLTGFLSDALGGGGQGLLYAMAALQVFALLGCLCYVFELRTYLREKI